MPKGVREDINTRFEMTADVFAKYLDLFDWSPEWHGSTRWTYKDFPVKIIDGKSLIKITSHE